MKAPATILVVEDDADILRLVQLYLEKYGYKTVTAKSGRQGLRRFRSENPHLVILDVMLPDLSGIEICRQIREHSQVPILFLSAKTDAKDVVVGLELGADDYVTKPFDPDILIARVKANLRRRWWPAGAEQEGHVWRGGHLEVDLLSYEVWVGGKAVPLFAKERQLLLLFIQNPNRVFNVDQLYGQIWGPSSDGDPRTVVVHIHNLRKKIEPDPSKPTYIQTVRGFGYKFSAGHRGQPG